MHFLYFVYYKDCWTIMNIGCGIWIVCCGWFVCRCGGVVIKSCYHWLKCIFYDVNHYDPVLWYNAKSSPMPTPTAIGKIVTISILFI